MLINIPNGFDFTFVRGGRVRAFVDNGKLYIDSRCISWDDLMYAFVYDTKDTRICPYCGKPITGNTLTIDHMWPKSFGGVSIPDNMLPCHYYCNHRKSDLSAEEFRKFQKLSGKDSNNFKTEVIRGKNKKRYIKGFLLPDDWVTYCYPNDLNIREYYKNLDLFSLNKSRKFIKNLEYIRKYRHLKRPIIVDANFWILDGYTWYVAAVES